MLILGEPTSSLDHVCLGYTQRECQISDDIVVNYKEMFGSRIPAGAKEKLPTRAPGKPDAETISSWSNDMEGHEKKCVESYCKLASETTKQMYKVASLAGMIIKLKKKMDHLENYLQFAQT